MNPPPDRKLSTADTLELRYRYQAAGPDDRRKIRDLLCLGFARLPGFLARKHFGRGNPAYDDLVQEGSLILIETAAAWLASDDPKPFALRAYSDVVHGLLRFYTLSHNVLKVGIVVSVRRDRLRRHPEIAGQLTPRRLETLRLARVASQARSLSSRPPGDDAEAGGADIDPASPEPGPREMASRREERNLLGRRLARLNPVEAAVVLKSFGIDGRRRTLTEIGAEIGVSRQRVAAIRDHALARLRRSRGA